MIHKKFIGVGCFHFGIKTKAPFTFRQNDYIKHLKEALNSITNLANLEIETIDEFDKTVHIGKDLSSIDKGQGYFPAFSFLGIDFKLHIPFRIQKEIKNRIDGFVLDQDLTGTEDFRVTINYAYHSPVAFIEPLNPSKDVNPSESVFMVREFLKQEFNKIKSNYIRFECLGPSPFHAEFIIEKSKKKEISNSSVINSTINSERGYDKIIFTFNAAILKNIEKAREFILFEIVEELGLFYSLQQDRVKLIHDWISIEKSVQALVKQQKESNALSRMKNFIIPSYKTTQTIIALTEFEVNDMFTKNEINDSYHNVYKQSSMGFLRSYIDVAIKDLGTYPTKQMFHLIDVFVGQRSRSVENFFLLISAIGGAIVGGVLSFLLSSGH